MTFDADRFFEQHPEFRRTMMKFLSLHDAADVLDDEKPPHGTVAAAFLREVADELMRRTGVDQEFIDAAVAGKPPAAWQKSAEH